MTSEELQEEIKLELDFIGIAVTEAIAIYQDLGNREPTIRDKTAAAAFMAQFYGGLENILKKDSPVL
jgi:hypothetical protein